MPWRPAFFSWQRSVWLSWLAVPLAALAERHYIAIPALPSELPGGLLPSLSIIVPARNEADNLRRLLPSLQALDYPGPFEVIVVDDDSGDGTAAVAAAHGVRVVKAPPLPPDWQGKAHACHYGAQIATGEWLLFTDADTVHAPQGPALAVAYACRHELDALSLWLRQVPHGRLDALVLAVAFTGLFSIPAIGRRLCNGQFVLIHRRAYEQSGGFAAVRGEALEDLALGRHLQRRGYRIVLLRGEHAAQVTMYRGFRSLWHGLTRLGSESLRWAGWQAVFPLAFVTALVSPLVTAVGVLTGRLRLVWLLFAWPAAVIALWPWARRLGRPDVALWAPLGGLWVLATGLRGLIRRALGRGLLWKGRRI